MNGRVAAVVVSYNVRDLLLACVESLVEAKRLGELNAIVVVDNASRDGSARAVRARFPEIAVIDAPNRGYGAGANVGIAATDHEYVLILNPDTVIPPGTVAGLASFLDEHPWVAIVGPLLRRPDGSVQPTRRRFPEQLTPLFESTILEQWWPGNRWARRFQMRDTSTPENESQDVDWVVGAALLARRAAIEQVGGFDASFRMYSEEVEWCLRFHQRGWKIAYYPTVEIIHHEGASASQDVSARQVEFDTSRVRLARRMYGSPTAELVRAGLLFGYGLQLARESVKWALGNQRVLRRRRIALYAGAIRSGLRDRRGVSS
ncbi:MAG: glycosyltransferase family 2 protein [Thermomicrobiales bacterium]